MKKKILSVAALACVSAMCLSFVACTPSEKDAEAVSFVSLDINPSIEITLDKNDKVLSVYGANEDGQVLLYGEEGLVGVKVETAVGKITELAVGLGYLDEDNIVVETSVSTAESEGEELREKINAKITLTAGLFDLDVVCEGEGTYSLQRKLESLKEQYPDLAAVQSLTVEKLKLVLSAVETGAVTVEEAVEMTNKELIAVISEAHVAMVEYATEAYNKAVSVAQAAYDQALGNALDGIYLSYYMSHNPSTAYYGAIYQAYRSSARTLNAIADSIGYVQNVSKVVLTDEQTAVVAAALGVEDTTVLQDSDGNVTIKSVEAYADKLFKNKKEEIGTKENKKLLTETLRSIESEIRESIDEIAQTYEPQIAAVTGIVKSTAEQFKGMLYNPTISEKVKELITECSEISDEIEALTADGDLTAEEIRLLAEKLEEKAQAVLDIMESELSEEELAEIAALQEKAIATISNAKEQYEDAIEQAAAQAKQRLQELKAARSAK